MSLRSTELRTRMFEFSSRVNVLLPRTERYKVVSAIPLQVPLVSLASIKFENLEKLGKGVNGTCYRHKFSDMEETVCIKVFKRSFIRCRGWHAMLLEAEWLKKLDDTPGIPKLIAFSPLAPCAIIMSDVGTLTYQDWLSINRRNPREVISVLKKTSMIIDRTHERGLSHNDLHERNIVVDDKNNEPTIVDVGNMLPFGVRSWRTVCYTHMPWRQMLWIDVVDASGNVIMLGKLIRYSLPFLSLDAPIRAELATLAKECIRQDSMPISDVVVKLDGILSLMNDMPCNSSWQRE
ncbi:uncharacterized protein [Palaemon carinicauda]|uniref:uncharacterized protein n=1 Tax=Palaemon carinicauda TaxID=392227 RepID=UPI0035B57E1E